jgi:hypothetical protein
MKCPGQDRRHWKTEDIFDVSCPRCGKKIEFLKTMSGDGANPVEPKLPILESILDVSSGVPMLNSVWETCPRNERKKGGNFSGTGSPWR